MKVLQKSGVCFFSFLDNKFSEFYEEFYFAWDYRFLFGAS